jgi:hypothetical protein
MWLKSNHIAAFALDLKSTYEGEHMIFSLLRLANLTQNDLQLNGTFMNTGSYNNHTAHLKNIGSILV